MLHCSPRYALLRILGATIQPQAFFIGSKLSAVQRIPPEDYESDDELPPLRRTPSQESNRTYSSGRPQRLSQSNNTSSFTLPLSSRLRGTRSFASLAPVDPRPTAPNAEAILSPSKREVAGSTASFDSDIPYRPTLACVRAHLGHAQFDIAGSLLGFAVVINSAILIVSAAVFYYGDGAGVGQGGVTDLFDAYELIRKVVGPGSSISRQ